jgi:predicted O-linked N-acetylglucosamine transferase (SPINDLY family)/SAM-dependent methyltransferase
LETVTSLKSAALAAIDSGELHLARPLWHRLCEHEPLDPDNWVVLSAIDERLGFLPAALDHLRYARHLSPDDPDVWLQSARIRWQMHDFDGAFADMSQALAIDFGDRDVRLAFAAWLMDCHRFVEALVHYRFLHLAGIQLESRAAVKTLACALCAGDADTFSEWSHALAGEADLPSLVVEELEYLVPPDSAAELDIFRDPSLSMRHPQLESIRDRMIAPSRYDWRTYFDLSAHTADYVAARESSTALETVAAEVERILEGRNHRLLHVVDLGCGSGRLADALARTGLPVIVTGVDRSPECIRVANRKNRYDNLLQADLDGDMPADVIAAADCIVIADLLRYCADPVRVVSAALDHMQAGCRLVLMEHAGVLAKSDMADLLERVHTDRGCDRSEIDASPWTLLVIGGTSLETVRCTNIAFDPGLAREATANRLIEASQLMDRQRYQDSRDRSMEVLREFPESSQARLHVGLCAQDQKRFDDALREFRHALSVHKGFAGAWFQVGSVYQQREPASRLAVRAYRNCLRYAREHSVCLTNVAQVLLLRGQHDAAWRALKHLLVHYPLEAELLERVRGLVLQHPDSRLSERLDQLLDSGDWLKAQLRHSLDKKYIPRAQGLIERLAALDGDASELLFQRAQLAEKSGDLQRAVGLILELIRQDRNNPAFWQFLVSVRAAQGRLKSAFRLWSSAVATAPPDNPMYQNRLFFSNYCEHVDRDRQATLHRHWGARLPRAEGSGSRKTCTTGNRRRIRIGYVSGDFRMHSVAIFFYNILKYRDADRFEVYCYSTTPNGDHMTTKLRLFSDRWREIGRLGDEAAARLIERDGIDILVDLAGHTAGNRLPLFARRPAPIQCTYLGYANTTGLEEIDYRITDPHADPVGMTEHLYTEELVRLRNGFLSYSRHLGSTPVTIEDDIHPTRHYTFVCCNNVYKVNDAVIEVWSRILHRLPAARLLLKAHNLHNTEITGWYQKAFRKRGIGADRVHLMNTIDVNEHQNLYNHVDVALDPFPYNGTTTTCDALWMGVPVLTLAGDRHAGRVGVSLLNQTGLTDWIATDEDDYVDKAIRFSRDRALLRHLRLTMRQRLRNSPLMKPGVVTADLERAFLWMWERHRDGSTGTDSTAVAADGTGPGVALAGTGH